MSDLRTRALKQATEILRTHPDFDNRLIHRAALELLLAVAYEWGWGAGIAASMQTNRSPEEN